MPLLEYKCACGRGVAEVFGRYGDAPETINVCEFCGGPLKKQFPLPAVRVDYSDMKYFGTKQWADNERSKVGIGSG